MAAGQKDAFPANPLPILPVPAAAGLGAAALLLHQGLLTWGGLADYINSNGPRPNWFAANKEGLLSLPGYLALEWLGVALGRLLQQLAAAEEADAAGRGEQGERGPEQRKQRPGGQQHAGSQSGAVSQQRSGTLRFGVLGGAAAAGAALWLAAWASGRWVQPVCRRACNATYVLWVLALSVQSVALFLAVGRWAPGPVPLLLQRVNEGMLEVFLAANLLTGLVNLSLDTLAVGWWGAAGVLLVYMAAVCSAASAWPALQRRLAAGPGRGRQQLAE